MLRLKSVTHEVSFHFGLHAALEGLLM